MSERAFPTNKDLELNVDNFLRYCKENEEPITLLSFYVFCGINKDTGTQYIMGRYDDENNKYSVTLKRFRDICEAYAEKQLFTNKNTAGIIFNLKNNYGWKDKTEVEHQVTNIDVKISNLIEDKEEIPLIENPTT